MVGSVALAVVVVLAHLVLMDPVIPVKSGAMAVLVAAATLQA
jgi:hypothetical protein